MGVDGEYFAKHLRVGIGAVAGFYLFVKVAICVIDVFEAFVVACWVELLENTAVLVVGGALGVFLVGDGSGFSSWAQK